MRALNNHSLIEIQDWDDVDEDIASELRRVPTTSITLPAELGAGIFAAHVIAAAVTAALQGGANLAVLFNRMVSVLKTIHDKNSSWGPMFVTQPSTITRHVAYVRIAREEAPAQNGSRDGRALRGAKIALAARGRKGA
jgi:hypothetical protein